MYIVQEAMLQTQVGVAKLELDTPCLLLDLDRLDRNIERMAALASSAGVGLRPHAKTHKLVEVAERQLAAGSAGLTVAKLGEAELFADNGIRDLFIAYPLWGESKWRRLCDLAEHGEVRVAVDSEAVCLGIASAATRRGLTIPVRIEVDTGFGRCGVQDARQARGLAELITSTRGLRLAGLMSFAGQTYASPDSVREAACADAAVLLEIAGELRDHSFEVAEISIGSTPSAAHLGELAGVTEFRPGTYVFSDRDQVSLGWGTEEDCALTVLATVVSRPTPARAVIDAGTKTLSSDRAGQAGGWGAIVDHPTWTLATLNEEHGLIELPPGEDPPIGATVEIVPNHACGALNLHDWLAVVVGDEVRDWWRVAGRGLVR
jgi:D-serine deaminase-like pyridoxal phosphate-dependent protein